MSNIHVVEEARLHVADGAHYIKRGFGHMYDAAGEPVGEVVQGRRDAVKFFVRGGTQGVPDYARYVCRSEEGGIRVCAGRCATASRSGLPIGDPDNPAHLGAPQQYLWDRPENFANGRRVPGECCAMKRHFDCLGFVNYCYWRVMRYPPDPGVTSMENWYNNCSTLVGSWRDLQPGDILLSVEGRAPFPSPPPSPPPPIPPHTFSHIGIALSSLQVIHSAGYDIGVVITEIANPTLPGGNSMHWLPFGRRPRCFRGAP